MTEQELLNLVNLLAETLRFYQPEDGSSQEEEYPYWGAKRDKAYAELRKVGL